MSAYKPEAGHAKEDGNDICVIIAAFNAEATIAGAIQSALNQPRVSEVVVVDDASHDATSRIAENCSDGSERLKIIRLEFNQGPSMARNLAIAASKAPWIAILDADDRFLPGRFAHLTDSAEWDMLADNIAIVSAEQVATAMLSEIAGHRICPRNLNATAFVEGCISRPERYRRELAFLKPVMRRTFLEANGLAYDENMRLAEDYDLYLRALLAGARFRIGPECTYLAIERANSLSAMHSVDDLARFDAAINHQLTITPRHDRVLRRALIRQLRQSRRKLLLRTVLERKRASGAVNAMIEQLHQPISLLGTLAAILGAKLQALRPGKIQSAQPVLRFLLDD